VGDGVLTAVVMKSIIVLRLFDPEDEGDMLFSETSADYQQTT
jgi:hypothetical protein